METAPTVAKAPTRAGWFPRCSHFHRTFLLSAYPGPPFHSCAGVFFYLLGSISFRLFAVANIQGKKKIVRL